MTICASQPAGASRRNTAVGPPIGQSLESLTAAYGQFGPWLHAAAVRLAPDRAESVVVAAFAAAVRRSAGGEPWLSALADAASGAVPTTTVEDWERELFLAAARAGMRVSELSAMVERPPKSVARDITDALRARAATAQQT